MVSEYANGRAPWLPTMVFVGWGISCFALVVALRPRCCEGGLLFLTLAGGGQIMGALLDIIDALRSGPIGGTYRRLKKCAGVVFALN